jgi:hypothetical protein
MATEGYKTLMEICSSVLRDVHGRKNRCACICAELLGTYPIYMIFLCTTHKLKNFIRIQKKTTLNLLTVLIIT